MKRRIRYPEYFADFACVGGACEDSCCNQWRIYLDQDTFENYSRIEETELRRLLDEYVESNRSSQSEARYGTIRLTADRRCPFLTPDCLCILQQRRGVAALSQTCLTYPRVFNSVNNILEGAAEISCPEAARQVLLNPAGIRLIEGELDLDQRFALNNAVNSVGSAAQFALARYFQEVRDFAIDLVQDRRISLSDRLTLLGMVSSKIQASIDSGEGPAIPAILEEYVQLRLQPGLSDELARIPVNATRQLTLLKALLDEKNARGTNIAAFRECHEQFLGGLGFNRDLSPDQIVDCYHTNYGRYFVPFMTEKEYILENYCVNYLFRYQFPIFEKNDYQNIFKAAVRLLLNYALLKLYLIGLGGFHGGLTDELAVKWTYSFGKAVEHDSGFMTDMIDFMEHNGLMTLAHLTVLIRN
ncbi:MAG: flagellin lysine-N-methylase [Candidatus Neomarinimicrobiota bacterium]